MAYTINRYDGQQLAQVTDATIDSNTCDLKLIGRNYAGYGEAQNENFVHLLENFARDFQPDHPLRGQIWYDTKTYKLKFYDGSQFRSTARIEVSTVKPTYSNKTLGDFWFDTANFQLKAWDGADFALIGPEQSLITGQSKMRVRSVKDIDGNSHVIIEAVIDNEVVFIISPVTFELGSGDQITGFDVIHQGTTLVNTKNSTNGVTSTEHRWWGTATNADKVGGFAADSFHPKEGSTSIPLTASNLTASTSFLLPGGSGDEGKLRYSDGKFEGYTQGSWVELGTGSGPVGGQTLTFKRLTLLDPNLDEYDDPITTYNGSSAVDVTLESISAAPLWGIATTYDISDTNADRCVLGFQTFNNNPYLGLFMKNTSVLGINYLGDIFLNTIQGTGDYLAFETGTNKLIRSAGTGESGGTASLTVKKFILMDPNVDDYQEPSIVYTPSSSQNIDIKSLNAAPLWGIATDYDINNNLNINRCVLGFQKDINNEPYIAMIYKNTLIWGINSDKLIHFDNVPGTGSYLTLDANNKLTRAEGTGTSGGNASLTINKFKMMDPGINDYDPTTVVYTPSSAQSLDIKTLNAAPLWGIADRYDNGDPAASSAGFALATQGVSTSVYFNLRFKGKTVLDVNSTNGVKINALNGSTNIINVDASNILTLKDPAGTAAITINSNGIYLNSLATTGYLTIDANKKINVASGTFSVSSTSTSTYYPLMTGTTSGSITGAVDTTSVSYNGSTKLFTTPYLKSNGIKTGYYRAEVSTDTINDVSISSWGVETSNSGSTINLSNIVYIFSNDTNTGLIVAGNPTISGDHPLKDIQCRSLYYAGTLVNASDVRIKENINTLSYGLNEIMNFTPVTFNWIDKNQFGDRKNIGFIAQEIQQQVPELVSENNDGFLGVDYAKITPIIVKAIQELKNEYDAVIAELRNEIANLKK